METKLEPDHDSLLYYRKQSTPLVIIADEKHPVAYEEHTWYGEDSEHWSENDDEELLEEYELHLDQEFETYLDKEFPSTIQDSREQLDQDTILRIFN